MQRLFFVLVGLIIMSSSSGVFGDYILVNNDDGAPYYVDTGDWTTSSFAGYEGGTYRFTEFDREYSTAVWTPDIVDAGFYYVTAIFLGSPNRTNQAPYTITHADGTDQVIISQYDTAGQGRIREVYLGVFYFEAGTGGNVMLSNDGGSNVYIADCIRFIPADDLPLEFSEMKFTPDYPGTEDPVDISVRVLPERLTQEVYAHYTVEPEGISETVSTQYMGDGYYEAQIPSQASQSVVQFYFTAKDTSDNIFESDHISYQVDRGEYRSIWVQAWGSSFHWPARAEQLVQICRDNNINTIMLQVRKVGDAYYDSSIEPWATNIHGPSDYDPLQYIIDLAHDTSEGQPYIHVHAWFVMQRIDTVGMMKQNHPDHILNRHPEYVMYSNTGGTVVANSYYLDPGHPGSVEENIAVILDCMQNYDIDGVNLDYIRYPGNEWGYNPTSLERFQAAYQRNDIPEPDDEEWSDWRRLLITNQIKKLYIRMMQADPNVILTACTVNWGYEYTEETFPYSRAYSDVFQDWVGWLREGIIDYNAFMNYARSHHYDRYKRWTDLSLANDDIRGSIIGIGAYLHDAVEDSIRELQYARDEGAAGLNIYAYDHEVNNNNQGESQADFYEALRTELYQDWVDPPVSEWKENPAKGIIEGTVTFEEEPVDFCSVIRNDDEDTQVYSDGMGWYGMLEVPVGSHILTFSREGYPVRTLAVEVFKGGDIITMDVELSEPDQLDYNAQVVDYSVPDQIFAGRNYYIDLTLKNTGNAAWSMQDKVYLGTVGDHDYLAPSEYWRVGMQHDVMPGENYTYQIYISPSEPGFYTTRWRMLREENFWFGEQFNKEIEVKELPANIQREVWELIQ